MLAILHVVAFSPWHFLRRLGGVGLIALGIADASVVPLPGSVDVLTIVLAASNRGRWAYYASMAVVGTVFGAYLTYRLGKKGGKQALEKRFSEKRMKKVYAKFEKGGFQTIFIPALLPPPVPLVPFVLAAGALEYPAKKFLTALASARIIRYFGLALLASIYGRSILGFFHKYYQPVLWIVIALAVAGGITGLILYLRYKHSRHDQDRVRGGAAA